MMESWRRFRALSGRDRLLVAEAAALLGLVWLGLSILPFPTLRRLVDRFVGHSDAVAAGSSSEPVRRVAWAVLAVARRWPVRTTCLVEALAADAMLRRGGYAPELRFGVRPPGSGSKPLEAHAWLEHQGVVVLGDVENLPGYAVLSGSGSAL